MADIRSAAGEGPEPRVPGRDQSAQELANLIARSDADAKGKGFWRRRKRKNPTPDPAASAPADNPTTPSPAAPSPGTPSPAAGEPDAKAADAADTSKPADAAQAPATATETAADAPTSTEAAEDTTESAAADKATPTATDPTAAADSPEATPEGVNGEGATAGPEETDALAATDESGKTGAPGSADVKAEAAPGGPSADAAGSSAADGADAGEADADPAQDTAEDVELDDAADIRAAEGDVPAAQEAEPERPRPTVGVVYEPDESPDGFPLEYGNIIVGLPKSGAGSTLSAADEAAAYAEELAAVEYSAVMESPDALQEPVENKPDDQSTAADSTHEASAAKAPEAVAMPADGSTPEVAGSTAKQPAPDAADTPTASPDAADADADTDTADTDTADTVTADVVTAEADAADAVTAEADTADAEVAEGESPELAEAEAAETAEPAEVDAEAGGSGAAEAADRAPAVVEGEAAKGGAKPGDAVVAGVAEGGAGSVEVDGAEGGAERADAETSEAAESADVDVAAGGAGAAEVTDGGPAVVEGEAAKGGDAVVAGVAEGSAGSAEADAVESGVEGVEAEPAEVAVGAEAADGDAAGGSGAGEVADGGSAVGAGEAAESGVESSDVGAADSAERADVEPAEVVAGAESADVDVVVGGSGAAEGADGGSAVVEGAAESGDAEVAGAAEGGAGSAEAEAAESGVERTDAEAADGAESADVEVVGSGSEVADAEAAEGSGAAGEAGAEAGEGDVRDGAEGEGAEGEAEAELSGEALAERLAAEQAAMALITALMKLRGALAGSRLPLDVVGADEARQQQKSMLDQLDDYILPRLVQLEAPILAVVGGSTGAGKSTLVNSVIGKVVSEPGVLRPTTRSPVLIHHPADADWFVGDRVLPGMARTTEGSPGGMEDPGQLRLVASDTVPRGLAVLDAPDIDSVVEANRDLATQLLAAADLWLFVTTAARYSDAVPWEFLQSASDRSTAVAVVLDRAPAETIDDITGHLAQMLLERGLGDSPLFSIKETVVDGNGMLPAETVVSIRDWLVDLAADAEARAAVVRRTLHGAVTAMVKTTPPFAAAVRAQGDTAAELRSSVEGAYDQAFKDIATATQDATLLRGEVLARWQEFVGTGELLKGLQGNAGKLRDKVKTSLAAKPAATTRDLNDAIESGLSSLLIEQAEVTAERAEKIWQASPAGRQLLAVADGTLGTMTEGFPAAAEQTVREWQGNVLELVRKVGTEKRLAARILEAGVNGLALSVMVVLFAENAGIPTGAELSAGVGSAVVGQKLLTAVYGDDAVQTLVTKAREDLDGRVHALMDAEFARYLTVLDQHPVDAEAARQLTEAARAVEDCT
ncbi:AAA family ATPase [Kribbella sandramycini]|uniref:Dynamin family protein n=1 Tax=Kribbella sandramycini TaxID=60450 RepID=A0A841SFW6_9ACTN|nr:AAA family ATPase [Kribbella sandramycini]MBB6567852.1 hypothetical protein [Kribbella sandramycini]